MKAIRVHDRNGKSHAFLLPLNFFEKVALWRRGYRYAPHVMSRIPWWKKKPEKEES